MSGRVLLVIDMLRDFIEPGGALSCGEPARRIVPLIVEKVKEFSRQGDGVIFIADAHEKDDREFSRFPIHCVKGSDGARLIAELEPLVLKDSYKVFKNRYSGFFRTDLSEILETLQPAEVHVVGVCANICILYTVEELCNRDYRVVVYHDGVASFDEEAHKWALQQMQNVLGVEIR
ncbi:MAG: cysteine hydrolase [Peptococcaceae bacterium]|nr:MAG: cysteine hydrolase [Peptococcaceae bacterium]